jgi:hypothetical protein
MTMMKKWKKYRKMIADDGRFNSPMIEPEAKITTECMVAALLTIAEVIQERD